MLQLIHTEKSFILIKDSLEYTGVNLLLSLINIQLNKNLHIFCYEQPSNWYKTKIKDKDNLIYYDSHNNFFEDSHENDVSYETLIKPFVLILEKNIKEIRIVIDSLAYLILEFGLNNVYKLIYSLKNHPNVEQIICLLHSDMVIDSEDILSKMIYLTSIYIEIEYDSNNRQGKANIRKRFSNGKIDKKIENFVVNELTFELQSTVWEPRKSDQRPTVDLLQVAQKLTTFKLTLNEKEKAAKAQVVLPYTNIQNQKSSQIFYVPDENDDFDEEDPDEDEDLDY